MIVKGAVYFGLFTVASLVNSALDWHLPLPDLIPNTEPLPPCVLEGAPLPGQASITAYGQPAVTAQPAGFGAVFPDLASAIGETQGKWLHKLNGPPPTQAQITHAADAVTGWGIRYVKSLRAGAQGKAKPPAEVSAYRENKRAAYLAQNATSCNPCQPGADGSTKPYNHAGYATGEDLARRALTAAGFTGRHLEEAVAIAEAESQFNPRAANPTSHARGLMQIMLTAHQDDPEITRWADPYANARMAYRISSGGTNWAPWSTWPQVRRHIGPSAQTVASTTCASYQTPGKGPGPWGGYQNGRVPVAALTHPRTAPTALFRPDAAAAFDQLSDAYRARFGTPLPVTDSYRDYASQVRTKAAKPTLAATPGTSDHGWGLAADLGGGIQRFGTPQYQWMKGNAATFGWVHEAWAEPNGSRPEAWHWTFTGKGAAA